MKNSFNYIKLSAVILVINVSCQKQVIPVVETSDVSFITETTALCGGTIVREGSSSIIDRGVCWSTHVSPEYRDNIKSSGPGPGNYSSSLTGLKAATLYYVRAYATNLSGTGYGMTMAFTTPGDPAALKVLPVSSLTKNSAILHVLFNPNQLSTIVSFEYGLTTSYEQTVMADQNPYSGNVETDIHATLSGLFDGTTYHFRIKLTNSAGIKYSADHSFSTLQTVIDYDGNSYPTVGIGTQLWMAENLRTTHYRDGSEISLVETSTSWASLTTGAYCNFGNNNMNFSVYGPLYNWYAVNDSRNICPVGYHVPTKSEWTLMINYLGGPVYAGEKLKEIGITHWMSPNTGADNSSGFTGLGGSFRDFNGAFGILGQYGYWWTSTHSDGVYSICERINYSNTLVNEGNNNRINGFSVRCIKN